MKHILWQNEILTLLDQRKLPLIKEKVECHNYKDIAEAIKNMTVRGAPAIGAVAAYGMAMAAIEFNKDPNCTEHKSIISYLKSAAIHTKEARPTAVNLRWAIDRMLNVAKSSEITTSKFIANLMVDEANKIAAEDIIINKSIGEHGTSVLHEKTRVLTYCNAGALATVDYGTALGVIRAGSNKNKIKMVYACETRPYLQGARLTTWELLEDNIPVTLIADNMAGYLMYKKMIDLIIVGADRITLKGDVANKIGTYTLAVLAKEHNIPFYVAAPLSTFDNDLLDGSQIPIEERDREELVSLCNVQIAPPGVNVFNPSFDITPSSFITAIITEKGIIKSPNKEKIINHLGECCNAS